ncbi:hypothetical protein CR513_03859, partial [Mucuna pruriens]
MAQGHVLRGFISGIAKHVTLVTSTNLLWALGEVAVHALSNIRALLLNATLLSGSCSRQASSTASEIWSHSLSGCPSFTDSDVNRK